MGYDYNEHRPWLFTDEGQRAFLKARDGLQALLAQSGAFTADKVFAFNSGDSPAAPPATHAWSPGTPVTPPASYALIEGGAHCNPPAAAPVAESAPYAVRCALCRGWMDAIPLASQGFYSYRCPRCEPAPRAGGEVGYERKTSEEDREILDRFGRGEQYHGARWYHVTAVLADLRACEQQLARVERERDEWQRCAYSRPSPERLNSLRTERDAAVRERDDLLDDMAVECPELADDEQMPYVSVQISPETYAQLKARKARPAQGGREGA